MLSQLLPNYLPFASDLALKCNISIEVIHFVVFVLAVIAASIIIEIFKTILQSILVIILCIITIGSIFIFGFASIPFLIIGIPGFLAGKWFYNKIRQRQLSGKIWSKFDRY